MQVCWLDILILVPLLVGLVRGIMRGLVIELMAVLAVILGFWGARLFGPAFAEWLMEVDHYLYFEMPRRIAILVAYVLLFVGITVVMTLVGKWLTRFFKAIHIAWVNHLLGAVLGTLKWSVIVLVLVFIVGQLDAQFQFMPRKLKADSQLYEPALKAANTCWLKIKTTSL